MPRLIPALCLIFVILASCEPLRADQAEVELILAKSKQLALTNKPVEAKTLLADAIAKWERLTRNAPDNAKLWHELAQLQAGLLLNEPALTSIDKAIALQPAEAEFHAARGLICSRLKKHDEAEKSYLKALELAPAVSRNELVYSVFLWTRGAKEKAVEHAKRAIELDPISTDAYKILSEQFTALDRQPEFLELLKQNVAANPQAVALRKFLGDRYALAGRDADAYEQFALCADLEPSDYQLHSGLICLANLLGKTDEAEKHLTRIRTLHQQGQFRNIAYFRREYFRQGPYMVAISEYFEPQKGDQLRYRFELIEGRRVLYHVIMGSTDYQTEVARVENKITEDQRMWHLDHFQGDIYKTLEFFPVTPPTYEEARAKFLKLVAGKNRSGAQ